MGTTICLYLYAWASHDKGQNSLKSRETHNVRCTYKNIGQLCLYKMPIHYIMRVKNVIMIKIIHRYTYGQKTY